MGTTLLAPGCCCEPGFLCGSCTIPQQDLTLSWTNPIIGDGSTTLTYTAPSTWISACTHNLIYQLLCTGAQPELRVYYFLSGSCPDGESQYCSTIRSNPFHLVKTGLTCGPSFLMTATCDDTGCPNLNGNGYTSFTVSA